MLPNQSVPSKKVQRAVVPTKENTVGSPANIRMMAAKKAAEAPPPAPAPTSRRVSQNIMPVAGSTQGGGASGGASAYGGNMPSASSLPTGAMFKKGGKATVKKMASGGMTSKSSASGRADGIASRGKTKCKMY